MKQINLLIALSLLTLTTGCWNEPTTNPTSTTGLDSLPTLTLLTTTYDDGTIKDQYQIDVIEGDTLWGGEYSRYYPDGTIDCKGGLEFTEVSDTTPNFETIPWENREGAWSFYYRSGQIELQSLYVESEKFGEWEYWSKDGSYSTTFIPGEDIPDSSGDVYSVDTAFQYSWIIDHLDGTADTSYASGSGDISTTDWTTTPITIYQPFLNYSIDQIAYMSLRTRICFKPVTIIDTIRVNFGDNPIIDSIDVTYSPFDTTSFKEVIEGVCNNTTGEGRVIVEGDIEFIKSPDWFTVTGSYGGDYPSNNGLHTESFCGEISPLLYTWGSSYSSSQSRLYYGSYSESYPLYFDRKNEQGFTWSCDNLATLTESWELKVTNAYGNATTHTFTTTITDYNCE
jgi:hypothetical protein